MLPNRGKGDADAQYFDWVVGQRVNVDVGDAVTLDVLSKVG